MKDYMTALYLRFCGSPEQDPEAETLAQQLRERLDAYSAAKKQLDRRSPTP